MSSEIRSTARPSMLRLVGFLVIVLGSAAAGIGATREWVQIGFAADTQGAADVSVYGTDVWEGKVILLAAGVALVATIVMRHHDVVGRCVDRTRVGARRHRDRVPGPDDLGLGAREVAVRRAGGARARGPGAVAGARAARGHRARAARRAVREGPPGRGAARAVALRARRRPVGRRGGPRSGVDPPAGRGAGSRPAGSRGPRTSRGCPPPRPEGRRAPRRSGRARRSRTRRSAVRRTGTPT